MPENTNTNDNNGGTPPANTDPKGNTPPAQNGDNKGQDNKAPDTTSVDFSKLSDDQLAKVLEDPRTFNLPRIKELREAAKKAKEYEASEAKRQEEELKKKGEFETLAKTKEEEANTWKTKFEQSQINNAIMAEAAKQGITRLDLVDKLIDKSKIQLAEDGTASGVTEAVTELITNNEFLKGETKSSLGGGTNPTDTGAVQEFTITQIQDPAFYQKNREAIQIAQAKGKIVDDRA